MTEAGRIRAGVLADQLAQHAILRYLDAGGASSR
jgi:hypothetical protein